MRSAKQAVVLVVVSLLSATLLVACAAVNKAFAPDEMPKECLQRIPLKRSAL